MEYWLKENRNYLAAVGGIAVFALVYHLAVLGPIRGSSETAAAQLLEHKQAYDMRTAGGVPEEAALNGADADLDAQRRKLEEMTRRLQASVAEKYRAKGRLLLEPGALDNLRLELRNELADLAGQERDKFGFPAPVIESEQAAQDALLRLGVAEASVKAAIPALEGNGRVVSVDPFRGSDAAEATDLFLRRLPVEIRIAGNSESIFRVLHALQTGERYFCVDTFSMGRAATTGQDLFEATLVVSGLFLDSAKPLEPPKREE